jgi:hypothetical protein
LVAAAFLAGAAAAAGLAAAAFLAGAAAAAGLATAAFLAGAATAAGLAAAFLAVDFLSAAAGMSDSSINEGFGRKAFCLKHFHANKRRAAIVEQKKARSASQERAFA